MDNLANEKVLSNVHCRSCYYHRPRKSKIRNRLF